MSSIYEVVKPAFKILKFVGFISYKTEKYSTKTYLKPNVLHLTISSIIHVLLIHFTIYAIYLLLSHNDLQSTLEFMALIVYGILQVTYILFNVIIAKFENHNMLNIINKITDIEIQMLDRNINMKYRILKIVLRSVVAIWSISLLHIVMVMMFGLRNITEIQTISMFAKQTGSHLMFLSDRIFLLKYATLLLIPKHILYCFNASISSQVMRFENEPEKIKEFAKICQEFFDCFDDINSSFSLTILFQIGAKFSFTVVNLFNSLFLVTGDHTWYTHNTWRMLLFGISGQMVMILVHIILPELYLAEVRVYYYYYYYEFSVLKHSMLSPR